MDIRNFAKVRKVSVEMLDEGLIYGVKLEISPMVGIGMSLLKRRLPITPRWSEVEATLDIVAENVMKASVSNDDVKLVSYKRGFNFMMHTVIELEVFVSNDAMRRFAGMINDAIEGYNDARAEEMRLQIQTAVFGFNAITELAGMWRFIRPAIDAYLAEERAAGRISMLEGSNLDGFGDILAKLLEPLELPLKQFGIDAKIDLPTLARSLRDGIGFPDSVAEAFPATLAEVESAEDETEAENVEA